VKLLLVVAALVTVAITVTLKGEPTQIQPEAASAAAARETYQGKTINWWAYRAVRNRKEANQQRRNSEARGRTIKRMRAVARARLALPTGHWLDGAFLCIHHYEKHPRQGWQTATGNGFHGGLQMDSSFQRTYGPAWAVRAFGQDAERWPATVQIAAAIHAWTSRGFGPWPNTRKSCGL
jgi:hypothetical protein